MLAAFTISLIFHFICIQTKYIAKLNGKKKVGRSWGGVYIYISLLKIWKHAPLKCETLTGIAHSTSNFSVTVIHIYIQNARCRFIKDFENKHPWSTSPCGIFTDRQSDEDQVLSNNQMIFFAATTRETLARIARLVELLCDSYIQSAWYRFIPALKTRALEIPALKKIYIFNLCFVSIYIYIHVSFFICIYICTYTPIYVYIIFHFILYCVYMNCYRYINRMGYVRCCEHICIYIYMSIYIHRKTRAFEVRGLDRSLLICNQMRVSSERFAAMSLDTFI
jgi:hypothetical protein